MGDKMLTDGELIALAQQNNEKATVELIERYKYVPMSLARSYFLVGGDNEDLLQEGMIGLFKAISTFNEQKGEFKTYVYSCVKNMILSSIKKYNTKKNAPLNEYISLSTNLDDDDKTDLIQDRNMGPEELFIMSESVDELNDKIAGVLSKAEYSVFVKYIKGYTYGQISQELNKPIKSIDNAIQRIKKKLRQLFDN